MDRCKGGLKRVQMTQGMANSTVRPARPSLRKQRQQGATRVGPKEENSRFCQRLICIWLRAWLRETSKFNCGILVVARQSAIDKTVNLTSWLLFIHLRALYSLTSIDFQDIVIFLMRRLGPPTLQSSDVSAILATCSTPGHGMGGPDSKEQLRTHTTMNNPSERRFCVSYLR